jgi:hypothetical protein
MEKVNLVGLVEFVLRNKEILSKIENFEYVGVNVEVIDFMENDKVVVLMLNEEVEVYIDYDVDVFGNVVIERTFKEVMKDED